MPAIDDSGDDVGRQERRFNMQGYKARRDVLAPSNVGSGRLAGPDLLPPCPTSGYTSQQDVIHRWRLVPEDQLGLDAAAPALERRGQFQQAIRQIVGLNP